MNNNHDNNNSSTSNNSKQYHDSSDNDNDNDNDKNKNKKDNNNEQDKNNEMTLLKTDTSATCSETPNYYYSSMDQNDIDIYYMKQALYVAQNALEIGEVPVGCVIVLNIGSEIEQKQQKQTTTTTTTTTLNNTVIISHGANQVNATRDATRHAEIVAIDRLLSYSTSSDLLRLPINIYTRNNNNNTSNNASTTNTNTISRIEQQQQHDTTAATACTNGTIEMDDKAQDSIADNDDEYDNHERNNDNNEQILKKNKLQKINDDVWINNDTTIPNYHWKNQYGWHGINDTKTKSISTTIHDIDITNTVIDIDDNKTKMSTTTTTGTTKYNSIINIFNSTKDNMVVSNNNNNNNILSKCTLYVTCEPCIMCTEALITVNIGRVVYGCTNDKFGGCGGCTSFVPTNLEDKDNMNNNSNNNSLFPITRGVLENDAIQLLQSFYVRENFHAPTNKRKKKG